MKTIEESAQEYAEKTDKANAEWVMQDFKSGVEFAQRWIDVKDELPETIMETMKSGNYTYTVSPVLIKTSNGKFAIAKRYMFMDLGWYWMGSNCFNESVEFWRPIEYQ